MGKTFTFFFLIVVCAAFAICATPGQQNNTAKALSLSENPFTKYLKANRVRFVETPFIYNTSCLSEFPTYGSFCEIKSLLRYAQRDHKKLTTQTSSIINMIHSYSSQIDQVIKIAKRLVYLREERKIKSSKLVRLMGRSEFKQFERIIQRFENSQVIKSINSCWSQMSELRTNSLCSICSGRHKLFFSGSKALISDETCTGILNTCADSFEHFIDFITGMKNFATTLKNGLKKSLNIKVSTSHIIKVTEDIENQHINSMIHQYLLSNKQPSQIAWNLCASLINLASQGFITRFHHLLTTYRLELFHRINQNLNFHVRVIVATIDKENKEKKRIADAKEQERLRIEAQKIQNEANLNILEVQKNIPENFRNSQLSSNIKSQTPTVSGRQAPEQKKISRNIQTSCNLSPASPQPRSLQFSQLEVSKSNWATNTSQPIFNSSTPFFVGDVMVVSSLPVDKKVDSSYSSSMGGIGTNNNEASMPVEARRPMNMTSKFP